MSCFSICDSASRWRLVEDIKQRGEDGHFLTHSEEGYELLFDYYEDLETNNLYKAKDNDPWELRAKALELIVGSPFYAVGVIAVDLMAIILVVGQAVWHIFKQGCENPLPELEKLGAEILDDLRHALLTPLFWLALEGAALVTLALPLDGMKLMGDVQLAWFPGKTLQDDPTMLAVKRQEKWATTKSCLPTMWHRPYEKGAIWFVAACMLPRGNRNDKITLENAQVNRYEFKKEGA
jgi:hypothetical protein